MSQVQFFTVRKGQEKTFSESWPSSATAFFIQFKVGAVFAQETFHSLFYRREKTLICEKCNITGIKDSGHVSEEIFSCPAEY